MVVEVGAAGSVGFDWSAYLINLSAGADAQANLNVLAFGNAGVDYAIASAKAKANLVLVDSKFKVQGAAKIVVKNGEPVAITESKATASLDALKGDFGITLALQVPRLGTPPWEEKKFNYPIFNWKGIHLTEGVLFSFEKELGRSGFSVKGSADQSDVEINLDSELVGLFKNTVADMQENSGNFETKISQVLTNQAEEMNKFNQFIDGLKQ